MEWIFFIAGLGLLVLGAEILVKGGSQFAALLGLSPLAIGLTVVAYGTSMPELVVSLKASLTGQADIAVGNVVGSNIFNVLFILGLSALILPLSVNSKLVRMDVPIMIGVSVLLLLISLDGKINKFEGFLLTAGIVFYTFLAFRMSRGESKTVLKEFEKEYGPPKNNHKTKKLILNLLLIFIGLGILVLGARWLLESTVQIAKDLGVNEMVIGLTLIAAGTSLPELATSIIATIRGEREIAVGNVVGSNIYNILGILGFSSIAAKGDLSVAPAMVYFDIPFMTVVAIACWPIFLTGRAIARWEGFVFIFYYIAYTLYLYFKAVQSSHIEVFSDFMLFFVAPLTLITLAVSFHKHKKQLKHI